MVIDFFFPCTEQPTVKYGVSARRARNKVCQAQYAEKRYWSRDTSGIHEEGKRMESMASINVAILILSSLGLVMTNYREQWAALPDRIANPVLAAGFGITALVGTLVVLGAASIVSMNVLVNLLRYLEVW